MVVHLSYTHPRTTAEPFVASVSTGYDEQLKTYFLTLRIPSISESAKIRARLSVAAMDGFNLLASTPEEVAKWNIMERAIALRPETILFEKNVHDAFWTNLKNEASRAGYGADHRLAEKSRDGSQSKLIMWAGQIPHPSNHWFRLVLSYLESCFLVFDKDLHHRVRDEFGDDGNFSSFATTKQKRS
jgi:hypothetical protein